MRSAVILAQFYNIIPLRIRTIMHYYCTRQHLVIAVNVSTNYSSKSCNCSSYLTVAYSRGSQCKQPQHSAHSLSLAVTAHIGPVNIYINSFKMVTCLLPFRTAPSCIYPGTLTHCTACLYVGVVVEISTSGALRLLASANAVLTAQVHYLQGATKCVIEVTAVLSSVRKACSRVVHGTTRESQLPLL
jgi:hypothetical protein